MFSPAVLLSPTYRSCDGVTMRRREFIAGVAAAFVPCTVKPVRAQSKAKRLAIVHPTEQPEKITISGRRTFKAYFSELLRLGYVEGTNLTVERYSALGHPDAYARSLKPSLTVVPMLSFRWVDLLPVSSNL